MIGGDAASRILMEVMKGVLECPSDSPIERAYREEVKQSVARIKADGGMVEILREFP